MSNLSPSQLRETLAQLLSDRLEKRFGVSVSASWCDTMIDEFQALEAQRETGGGEQCGCAYDEPTHVCDWHRKHVLAPADGHVVVPREPSREAFDKLSRLWDYDDEETAETLAAILEVFGAATLTDPQAAAKGNEEGG